MLDAADAVIRRSGPLAPMDEIASEAGISKPILYRHFGDKGGLYQALADRYAGALLDELRAALRTKTDARTRLEITIDTYLRFIERERGAYDFLMHRAAAERPEAGATLTGFMRQVAEEATSVMKEDLSRYGLDPARAEPWAYGIVGMVYLAGDRWMEMRSVPRAEIVDSLVSLIWGGFVSLAGAGREAS